LPQIGVSAVMGAIIFLIQFLRLSDVATLLIQVPLGALIYIVGSKLLHIDSYEYVKGLIKSYTKK
ncbi:MAG: lipopolysaccharide biosynthesis protein, partial [Eubacterium sp.]|nr:lipopolysaccharide biosynthesis protein [Eubacterium sp.]